MIRPFLATLLLGTFLTVTASFSMDDGEGEGVLPQSRSHSPSDASRLSGDDSNVDGDEDEDVAEGDSEVDDTLPLSHGGAGQTGLGVDEGVPLQSPSHSPSGSSSGGDDLPLDGNEDDAPQEPVAPPPAPAPRSFGNPAFLAALAEAEGKGIPTDLLTQAIRDIGKRSDLVGVQVELAFATSLMSSGLQQILTAQTLLKQTSLKLADQTGLIVAMGGCGCRGGHAHTSSLPFRRGAVPGVRTAGFPFATGGFGVSSPFPSMFGGMGSSATPQPRPSMNDETTEDNQGDDPLSILQSLLLRAAAQAEEGADGDGDGMPPLDGNDDE